jgi:hypothetical protein
MLNCFQHLLTEPARAKGESDISCTIDMELWGRLVFPRYFDILLLNDCREGAHHQGIGLNKNFYQSVINPRKDIFILQINAAVLRLCGPLSERRCNQLAGELNHHC